MRERHSTPGLKKYLEGSNPASGWDEGETVQYGIDLCCYGDKCPGLDGLGVYKHSHYFKKNTNSHSLCPGQHPLLILRSPKSAQSFFTAVPGTLKGKEIKEGAAIFLPSLLPGR